MGEKFQILKLYKNLLKNSKKFVDYNVKDYSIRKIKYEFENNKNEKNPEKINQFLKNGEKSLELIKRQGIIN
jgi:LYR motif-containing protein 4